MAEPVKVEGTTLFAARRAQGLGIEDAADRAGIPAETAREMEFHPSRAFEYSEASRYAGALGLQDADAGIGAR